MGFACLINVPVLVVGIVVNIFMGSAIGVTRNGIIIIVVIVPGRIDPIIAEELFSSLLVLGLGEDAGEDGSQNQKTLRNVHKNKNRSKERRKEKISNANQMKKCNRDNKFN